jgi:hypothetical protein
MENKIIEVQKIVLDELERLNNDVLMKETGQEEIQRGNVISKITKSYVQLINTNLKVLEYVDSREKQIEEVNNILGISNESQTQ